MLLIDEGGEVAYHEQRLLFCLPQEDQHIFIGGDIVDPLKALRHTVSLVEGRMCFHKAVQSLHEASHIAVILILHKLPVQALLLVPLLKGCKLLSHKEKLLARMHGHEAVGCPQVIKLGIPVSRHFAYHGGLAVYHLIVGET